MHSDPQAASRAGPDHWLDPKADLIKAIAEAQYDAQCQASLPEEQGERHFTLPGCTMRMRYVGSQAAEAMTAAFAHRESAGIAADLNWRIVDTSLAGGFPAFPDPPRPLHPFGSLHRNAENNVLVERRPGFVTVFDAAQMRLTTLVDGLGSIDTDLAAKPLLRFLLSLLMRRGIVMCHAALVGGSEAGLLVTGKGGSGKSTIAAAALAGGAGFCGDDFVALEARGGDLIGHSLFATVMLTDEQICRFPTLARHSRRLRRDTFAKHLVAIAGSFGAQVRRSLRIDAVSVPQIVPSPRSELIAGSRAAMLRAVTPTSVFTSPWREVERTRFLFDHIGALEPLIYRSGSQFSAISEPLKERYGYAG